MAGSKELDLYYNFHFCGFSILAIRRSGNPASVAVPQMIHTRFDLTRVEYKIVRPKLFVRERYPKSFDSTSQLGPTPLESFWDPLFAQLTGATYSRSLFREQRAPMPSNLDPYIYNVFEYPWA